MQRSLLQFALAVCALFGAQAAAALPVPAPPDFPASSYILVAHKSERVLAAYNADKRVAPASITKIMTAYIVFDGIREGRLSLDDMVTVSEKAWRMGGSRMFLEVGDKVSVNKLLHGMIAISGNDAAVALAQYVAGSVSAFAQYMNHYAQKLGLENSHFVNASGWPAENHYMSARDMAILSSQLIADFPKLYEKYFDVKKFTYNGITQYNRNSLLWGAQGVDGVKTGHTETAGYCLVTSAERGGMRLISVVTGTASNAARTSASRALLNYGFHFYNTYKKLDAHEPIATAAVWKGASDQVQLFTRDPVYVTVRPAKEGKLELNASLQSRIFAPVEKGEQLGVLKVMLQDKVIQTQPLYAASDVPVDGFVGRLMDEFWLLFE